jgi:hypothetical protein
METGAAKSQSPKDKKGRRHRGKSSGDAAGPDAGANTVANTGTTGTGTDGGGKSRRGKRHKQPKAAPPAEPARSCTGEQEPAVALTCAAEAAVLGEWILVAADSDDFALASPTM